MGGAFSTFASASSLAFVGSVVAAVAIAGCARSSDADANPGGADASTSDVALDDAAAAPDARDASVETSSDTGADAEAAPPPSLSLHATSGWQIYPSGSGYHYGPSILIDTDKSLHVFTCSPGTNGAWDFIRYTHSTDGGHTWTPDVVALQPTAGSPDAYSTCDPGAIKVGAYFYVGYTSTTDSRGTNNQLFIGRATAPAGPYAKWNGTGWGGTPKAIVTYSGDPAQYGVGEPSMVLMGKKLFVYYTDADGVGHTDLSTTDDATVDDWPNHLTARGHVITRVHPAEDSVDVKYVDALARFIAVGTYDRFSPNASIIVYQSTDGVVFEPAPFSGARAQIGAHNAGISGDLSAHIDLAAQNFIAYAYQPLGNGWGNWPTFLDPVTLSTAPWGKTVAGEVSSIVGGNDWNWSGPRAWDGDPATVFSSASHAANAATEWAMVDVGAARSLTGVTITPRGLGYGFPVDFVIQTSADAATWTDVPGQSHTSYANPGGTLVTLVFGAPVQSRYLRLYATRLGADDQGAFYLQLGEIVPLVAP